MIDDDCIEYLLANKQQLQTTKDADFVPVKIRMPPGYQSILEHDIDVLSQQLGIDTIEIENGLMRYQLTNLKNAIDRKGALYINKMLKKMDGAKRKGDHRRASILARQMIS